MFNVFCQVQKSACMQNSGIQPLLAELILWITGHL